MSIVPPDIAPILGPGEQVQLYIKQKIYHPKINIDAVALTNQRIILRHPKDLALRKDYTDYSYNDIANAILDKGMLRSTIRCILRFGGEPLILGNLPNADAEKAYGIIRSNITRFQTPIVFPGYVPSGDSMPHPVPAVSQTTTSLGSNISDTSHSLRCPKCGTAAIPGAKFCASCGTLLAPSSVPSTQ